MPENINEEYKLKPRLYDIKTTCRLLSLSRSGLYKYLSDGRIESVHVGTRRLILAESIDAFVADLRRAA